MKAFAPYVPLTDGNLAVWMGTFKEKLGQLGLGLGLTEEEVQRHQDAAQAVIDNIGKADLKKAESKEAVSAKELVKQASLQQIRNLAARIKTHAAYTVNAGRELGIATSGLPVNVDNLRPALSAASLPGLVNISFKKQGTAGVSLYSRLKGQAEWQSIGVAKTTPFTDDTPLSEEGRPETREYKARCYDGFDEIGHYSDIATVVHGG